MLILGRCGNSDGEILRTAQLVKLGASEREQLLSVIKMGRWSSIVCHEGGRRACCSRFPSLPDAPHLLESVRTAKSDTVSRCSGHAYPAFSRPESRE